MKKTVALVVGSFLLMTSTSFAFSDLDQTHWAYNNIMKMQESNIISGFNDNTFRPDDSLTRDQFITIAVKGLNIELPNFVRYFEDSLDRWSEEYIKAAGYTMVDVADKEFRPNEPALREDVAMALVRLADLENSEYSLKTLNNFGDKDSISENRKKYVAIAVENGLMKGNADKTFGPKKSLTRAEGATVILNMLQRAQ